MDIPMMLYLHGYVLSPLFILMDYPTHIDTISMDLSIMYLKGLPGQIFYKKRFILSMTTDFVLANSADPDEMPHFIWIFAVWESTCLPV